MQVLIVAGGEGKRMQPLTTHKSLFQILGKPLITYLMSELNRNNTRFLVVTSPASLPNFKQALADWDVTFAKQSEPNGMANAVLAVRDLIDPNDSILVVSAAKLLNSAAYRAMLSAIEQSPTRSILAAYQTTVYKEGGYLQLDGDRVVGIVEKPGADQIPSPYYKLVLDYFPVAEKLLNELQGITSDNDDEYELGVTRYVQKYQTDKIVVDSQHVSLKHAHHILDAMKLAFELYLSPGIDKSAQIAQTAIIDSNVQIEAGAKVYDFAVIKGPAYIGKNTVIGNGALVRESSIEADGQVGYGSEVARSYLGPATKGHMIYVGDSIIEGSVNLSAGTVLANYRFDHRPVRASMPSGQVETGKKKFGSIIARGTITGVNTSLMPGTVVGKNVRIGSGCTIKGYLPDEANIQPNFATYDQK